MDAFEALFPGFEKPKDKPIHRDIEVATLVWQGWKKEDIAVQLKMSVADLEKDYANELARGAQMIEGRVITETMKRALSGDDKTLHLLLKSKFGWIDKAPDQVNIMNQVGAEKGTVIYELLHEVDKIGSLQAVKEVLPEGSKNGKKGPK